jgi:hypothetical protein
MVDQALEHIEELLASPDCSEKSKKDLKHLRTEFRRIEKQNREQHATHILALLHILYPKTRPEK